MKNIKNFKLFENENSYNQEVLDVYREFREKGEMNHSDALQATADRLELNYEDVSAEIEKAEAEDNEEWIDPAGGIHYGNEEDPASMYEEDDSDYGVEDDYEEEEVSDIEYYKDLVKSDRERLKNTYGGEAEFILQNLAHNQKMLSRARRAAKAAKPIKEASYQEREMDLKDTLRDLQDERSQVEIDMEQEAEAEGGPIADEYGSKLNDLDLQIDEIKLKLASIRDRKTPGPKGPREYKEGDNTRMSIKANIEDIENSRRSYPDRTPKEEAIIYKKRYGILDSIETIVSVLKEVGLNEETTPQYKQLIKRAKETGVQTISDLDNLIGDEFADENKPITGADYEIAKKQLRLNESETSGYKVPNNVVKVPDGDTGFDLVRKNYKRFIWTWNQYSDKKPNITNESAINEDAADTKQRLNFIKKEVKVQRAKDPKKGDKTWEKIQDLKAKKKKLQDRLDKEKSKESASAKKELKKEAKKKDK